MKKIFLSILAVLALSAFAQNGNDNASGLKVTTSDTAWRLEMLGDSAIRAYNESAGLELVINISNILPNSPQCLSNKRIKDVKMPVSIRKTAQKGDTDWQKSFEKMRILFSGGGNMAERRVYGSVLVKNNLKVPLGTNVNVGTLEFLAPFPCSDIEKSSMRISGMLSGGRAVAPLNIRFTDKN